MRGKPNKSVHSGTQIPKTLNKSLLTQKKNQTTLVIFLQYPCFYRVSPGVVLAFLALDQGRLQQAAADPWQPSPFWNGLLCDRKASHGGLTAWMAVAGAESETMFHEASVDCTVSFLLSSWPSLLRRQSEAGLPRSLVRSTVKESGMTATR